MTFRTPAAIRCHPFSARHVWADTATLIGRPRVWPRRSSANRVAYKDLYVISRLFGATPAVTNGSEPRSALPRALAPGF